MDNPVPGIKTPPSQKVMGQHMFFPKEDIQVVNEKLAIDSDGKDDMDINAKTAMNFNKKKEKKVDLIE